MKKTRMFKRFAQEAMRRNEPDHQKNIDRTITKERYDIFEAIKTECNRQNRDIGKGDMQKGIRDWLEELQLYLVNNANFDTTKECWDGMLIGLAAMAIRAIESTE